LNEAFEQAQRELKQGKQEQAHQKLENEPEKAILTDIELDTSKATYDTFMGRMRRSWAVILVSISEISPNIIFDAVSAGVPFILTKENGITDRIKEAAIFVNPLNKKEIVEKILWLADPVNRETQAEKVRQISFNHSWEEIADEIVSIWKKAI
jgi:glycosyltransferase involved in cell wall biosynthesis